MPQALPENIKTRLDDTLERHRRELRSRCVARADALKRDSNAHHLVYEVLGVAADEGLRIDAYQNVGRLLYARIGRLIEDLASELIRASKGGGPQFIVNSISDAPRRFGIDVVVPQDNRAHEIKWRDATTDGDHVRKEKDKVRCIEALGLIPVRLMFFPPERKAAQSIQSKIEGLYRNRGEAHGGEDAWSYLEQYTGVDLKRYLEARRVVDPIFGSLVP